MVKRPSRLEGWFRALGFGLQLSLALALVSYGIHSYIVRTRLQDAFAELDRTDPGWRLQDIEAARAVVPDKENSALRVMEVEKLLPASSASWTTDDLETTLTHTPPEQRLRPDALGRFRQSLQTLDQAVGRARSLCSMTRGRYPLVYARNPWSTLLGPEQRSREVVTLLFMDAITRSEESDAHGAVTSLCAALNAARSIGDEPVAISQLIRIANVIVSCRAAQRTLAQTEPDSSDLKELQDIMDLEEKNPYWVITCRGERALGNAVLEAMERGDATVSPFGDRPPDWRDRTFAFLIEDNVRAIHPDFFRFVAELKAAGELPPAERGPIAAQIDLEIQKTGPNPVTAQVPALPKLANAIGRCQAVVRASASALAAERYRRQKGDWPPSLDALAPDYLAAVPSDPFGGDHLLYRRLPDGIVVYSVGPDGQDDGGNVNPPDASQPGTDVGFRLWDVAKRRQPPLPAAEGR
jgi:hypothetical protein